MRENSYLVAMVTALCVGLYALGARADSFDWRNVSAMDYTTPVKSQGSYGGCWAFSAVSVLEAKLKITADDPNWQPDLSEQHLICDSFPLMSSALEYFGNMHITIATQMSLRRTLNRVLGYNMQHLYIPWIFLCFLKNSCRMI